MEHQETKTTKKTNWKLVGELTRGYGGHLAMAALSVVLAALFSYAAPFVTSFTLDYIIQGVPAKLPSFLLTWLEGLGGRDYLMHRLYLPALALVLCTSLNGFFNFWRRRSIAYAAEGMAKRLRDRLYRHLEDVPYDYHKHVSTGDLVQRCSSDVETVRRFVSVQLMEIIRTVAMAGLALVIMFSVDVRMSLISMVLMPILTVGSFVYFRFVRQYFMASDEAEGRLSTMLQENLTGIRVVRAFGQQASQMEKFTACNRDYRDKTFALTKLLGFYWGFSDMLGYLQILLSLAFGIYFAAKGELSLGNVTLFVTYTSMLTFPMRQLGRTLADMGKASVSLGRLDEILSAPVEKEPGLALTPNLDGDIVFEDVTFGYDAPNDVLDGVSFTAHPGQTVAILGSTGSGKSSLMQLLQRLYVRTGGRITINGTDINDIEHGHLRRHIGIVLQEPFLYSRTILDNIRIVDPEATLEEVYAAAKTAAVHDVITSFDQGYDTLVGERGVTLSGGQQQRVAIARMLMQKAPVLIFDDSMSAVDTETDAQIRDALKNRRHDGITFIISHRITTLCQADKILVLEDGRLVQEGTHETLMHQPGLYQRIAQIQDAATQLEGGEQE